MAEGRLLQYGDGNSMCTELNYVPKMNARELVEGYRSVLKRIYDQKSYYSRVFEFIRRYNPDDVGGLRPEDYLTLARSMVRQGVLFRGRIEYWKLFVGALTKYPRAFSTAITLAMMGYHFQKMTERVCADEK
jgi:hypothetical protein